MRMPCLKHRPQRDAVITLPQEASNPGETGAAGAPSSIERVVIIVMENHTFDNHFGAFPGAAGITEPASE
jgi:phospholipase C